MTERKSTTKDTNGMSGNNFLDLNLATMKAIVQRWLNEEMRNPPNVESVTLISNGATVRVQLTEPNP